MKKILTGVLSLMISASALAGGLLTNTNQSASFLRNPAQEGAIGIDALYSNPAGTAFLSEGFHLSLNWQMAAQQRIMTTTSPNLVPNGPALEKEFKGKAFAPIMPSFHAAYVFNDKWSASASFTVTGGGGKCEFDNGLPMFESLVASKPGHLLPVNLNQNLTGEQYLFGLQFGGTYKVTDELSVFGGVRTVYASNAYEGEIKDAQMMLDCSQSTIGFTPIIGMDLNLGKLNFGMKYEFRTKLYYETDAQNSANVENLAKEISLFASFADGAKFRNDIPAILTLGAEYSVLPSLRVSAGYTQYFDTDVKCQGTTTNVTDNTWEASFGVEYDINDKWLVSTGVRHTNYGFADGDMSNLNFNMDNYAIGIGGAYKVNEKITVNAGYLHSFYGDYEATTDSHGLNTIYERKNDTWGVGVDIKF